MKTTEKIEQDATNATGTRRDEPDLTGKDAGGSFSDLLKKAGNQIADAHSTEFLLSGEGDEEDQELSNMLMTDHSGFAAAWASIQNCTADMPITQESQMASTQLAREVTYRLGQGQDEVRFKMDTTLLDGLEVHILRDLDTNEISVQFLANTAAISQLVSVSLNQIAHKLLRNGINLKSMTVELGRDIGESHVDTNGNNRDSRRRPPRSGNAPKR